MNLDTQVHHNLYGHETIFNNLFQLYKNNNLPNKFLLSGEKGVGKSTLSYHLINSILSEDEEHSYNHKNFQINPENRSFKLIQNKSHPNFNLVDVAEDKKNIDINQIRDLISNLNKSSFNSKLRLVLIDNIELMNVNSVNALLKFLEEPNANINFILINNNKQILPTLKSRCINFKVFLSFKQSIDIINNIINADVYDVINMELIDNYITPGRLFQILRISNEYNIDLKKTNLKKLLIVLIKDKIYKKDKYLNEIFYYFVESFFRKNLTINNISLHNFYTYFMNKIKDNKIYNLDEETLLMELEEKVLIG